MTGGSGADTFRFDLSQNQGVDTIKDFDRKLDRFAFEGLSDNGVKGLVDDLDAISTFVDPGAHQDLVVNFTSGTKLVLSGLGTGHVDSWADIVLNPANDLIIV